MRRQPARAILALTLCLATLFTSVSGLAGGAVLCVDGDGCIAVEFAHAQHRNCHADHHHHDHGDACCEGDDHHAGCDGSGDVSATRVEPTDAGEPCNDVTLGARDFLKARRPDSDGGLFRFDLPTPAFTSALPASPDLSVPLPGDSPPHGGKPRAEMISLRATVLLV